MRASLPVLAALLLCLSTLVACAQAPLPAPLADPGGPGDSGDPAAGEVAPAIAAAPEQGGLGGRILFVRGGNLWVWGNNQGYQLTTDGSCRQPRWSPDGNAMIFVRVGESYGDLWSADLAGNNARALTANRAKNLPSNTKAYVDNSSFLTGPSWARLSNGGERIVYSTDRDSAGMALWVLNGLSGKSQPVFGTKNLPGQIEGASLSPDGKFVVFTYNVVDPDTNVRSTQIYLVDLDAGIFRALTNEANGAYDPTWSPDGSWIAYAARQGEDTNLFVTHPDGTGRQRLVSGGKNRGAGWSPDSSQLAFARQQGTGFGLYYVDVQAVNGGLTAGQSHRLGDFIDVDPASGVSWTR